MKQYVIIGNGVAAANCIEGIRSIDSDGKITVVSEENHSVYCRPLISYYLEGRTDLDRILYRGNDFYRDMNCSVLYGHRAIRLNAPEKQVVLDDGSILPYDSLCLATGSSPFIPPMKGLQSVPASFSFMTLDDALALEKAVSNSSKVLIVGAGLIGLKCAEGLRNRVAGIAVCDLADRVLSSILDAECAALIQRHLENQGISFYLGDSVERFESGLAVMTSGKAVEFDVLVLAVGVRANAGLIREAGGETGRGILVDDRMQTSIKDVYAAGDCTEGTDISAGQKRVLAILPNASFQGYTAGVNMAGGERVFDKGIPMNSIGFFAIKPSSFSSSACLSPSAGFFLPRCGGSSSPSSNSGTGSGMPFSIWVIRTRGISLHAMSPRRILS